MLTWPFHGVHGVKLDASEADAYLQLAVDGLIPEAIFDFAVRIEEDSDESKKRALSYYVLAAVLGDSDAIEALSDHFLYGEQVDKNDFVSGALRKRANHLKSIE